MCLSFSKDEHIRSRSGARHTIHISEPSRDFISENTHCVRRLVTLAPRRSAKGPEGFYPRVLKHLRLTYNLPLHHHLALLTRHATSCRLRSSQSDFDWSSLRLWKAQQALDPDVDIRPVLLSYRGFLISFLSPDCDPTTLTSPRAHPHGLSPLASACYHTDGPSPVVSAFSSGRSQRIPFVYPDAVHA